MIFSVAVFGDEKGGAKIAGISVLIVEKNIMETGKPYEDTGEEDWELRGTATAPYDNFGISEGVESFINVRESASDNAKVIGKMTNHNACDILQKSDDGNWYRIKSGDVTGWASADYIKTGWEAEDIGRANAFRAVTANTDVLNVRVSPESDSEVWTQIKGGEIYGVVDYTGIWVKILIDDAVGYIDKEYVDVVYSLYTAVDYTPPAELVEASNREKFVNEAMKYLGGRYVWGGETLGVGVDCSGFTMKLYEQFGIYLAHYAATQYNQGKHVSRGELQIGDLVFYNHGGGEIDHVAIYIGNGQVIHAANSSAGIKISNMDYRTPAGYASYF